MTTVHVHVHQVATGSFPLRVADLLFTDDSLLVPEYAHLTPLFGLARGKLETAAEKAREQFRDAGVAGVRELAEQTAVVEYEELNRVRLYESRIGRPKIALDTERGPPYAYRIHAAVDLDALAEALRSLGRRRSFTVARHRGLGFSPGNSLRRFLAGR